MHQNLVKNDLGAQVFMNDKLHFGFFISIHINGGVVRHKQGFHLFLVIICIDGTFCLEIT